MFFHRKRHVTADIIPCDNTRDAAAIEAAIRDNRRAYPPTEGQDYGSFVTGDRVAGVGALDLPGTVFGIEHGRAAAGSVVALLLVVGPFILVTAVGALALGGAILTGIGRKFALRDDSL